MYMKKIFTIITASTLCTSVLNQEVTAQSLISDSLDRNRIQRLETLPYYSFGKGVGITSPDSLYQLNIRFRLQNRATFTGGEGEDGALDAQIRRLRLRFDGYVGNPKITYAIQLSFAPGDVGAAQNAENINIIRDAVIWYQPNAKWTIGFGQTKLPGNRQRFNSSGALQLTDRTINNAKFNIDRDFGLQVHQLNMYKNRFSYNFKLALSQGEGRNFTKNDDLGLAYTGKVELYPFGAFSKAGEYFEGDIKREEKPKVMLSAAYQYNNKAKRSQGQQGAYLFEDRNIQSAFFDGILKYNGWALMGAYMLRSTGDESPITVDAIDNTKFNYVYVGKGYDVQASYITKSNYEIIGRYSNLKVHNNIAHLAPHNNQIGLGLTKYIWEHAFKIQSEVGYDQFKYQDNTTKGSYYVRFQIEIGI